MPETEQERLNRIGNRIYLAIVFTLTAVGLAVIVTAAVATF